MKFKIESTYDKITSTVNLQDETLISSFVRWNLYEWDKGWAYRGSFDEKSHAENYAKALKEASLKKSEFKEEVIIFEL